MIKFNKKFSGKHTERYIVQKIREKFYQNIRRNFQFQDFDRASIRHRGSEFIPKTQKRVKFFLKINRNF